MVKNPPANTGDTRDIGSITGLERYWIRKWHPTPVFLPGKFHGQRGLVGYKESDMTERVACTQHAHALHGPTHHMTGRVWGEG